VVLAALIAASETEAQTAQEFADGPHWYAAFGLGYHVPGTVDSRSTLPAPDGSPYDWQWATKNGAAVTVALGYRFTQHVRLEIQSGYYNSALASVHAPGADAGGFSVTRPQEPYGLCAVGSALPACAAPHDWTYMWTGMTNLIYDVLPDWRIDPFIGAGLGFAHVAHSNTNEFSGVPGVISPSNPAVQTFKNAGSLDALSQFSLQALAGLSYRMTSRLNLDLTYYHYFTGGQLRWNPENNTPGLPVGAGLRTGDFRGSFHDDSLIVSVRYAF